MRKLGRFTGSLQNSFDSDLVQLLISGISQFYSFRYYYKKPFVIGTPCQYNIVPCINKCKQNLLGTKWTNSLWNEIIIQITETPGVKLHLHNRLLTQKDPKATIQIAWNNLTHY